MKAKYVDHDGYFSGLCIMYISPENVEMLECLCSKYNFPEDGMLCNKDNETPFHHALKAKRTDVSVKVCSILGEHNINPDVVDVRGRKPGSHISKKSKDRRIKILHEAAERFKAASKLKGKRKRHGKSRKCDSDKAVSEKPDKSPVSEPVELDGSQHVKSPNDSEIMETMNLEDPTLVKVRRSLELILSKDDSYFNIGYKRQQSYSKVVPNKPVSTSKSEVQQHVSKIETPGLETELVEHADVDSDAEPVNDPIFPEFEDLPWEVECPEKVVRFFKDKRIPRKLQEQAVKKIQMLASGEWRKKLSKRVSRKIEHLYEARLTKSARILWEVVVQFSPRCSATSDHKNPTSNVRHVYSEVIRIWDIVLDHDNIHLCVQNIERSHERGELACDLARDRLVPMLPHSSTSERLPQRYFLKSEFEATSATYDGTKSVQYTPAGSTKEDEFNVITFYSFSSAAIRSMLEGENTRRDLPFKEWREEHDIITIPDDDESILLLGRSGTGKTTCCLYRMWNRFQTYWNHAKSSGPLIPSRASVLLQKDDQDCEVADALNPVESNDSEGACASTVTHMADFSSEEFLSCQLDDQGIHNPEECPEPLVQDSGLEHLHQVFITKNYILCAQMKKRFFDMAASSKLAVDHMAFEDERLPHNIAEINDLAYPLFLTSRQFLLLLDNSLGDGKNYFPREPDGSLAVKVTSSDYDHEDPDTFIGLLESESEDDETDEEGDYDRHLRPAVAKEGRISTRTEVTASYFKEVIWPKIAHSCIDIKTDPMLVWIEIKSFIKGSSQAMESDNGCISADEYEILGRKLAPNFIGNRSEVYAVFRRYQQYMQNHLNFFDECDCVHNIYTRMNNIPDLPWSIHHFYVDEVQDFTQAELSIVLRCCRNPNGLFLTGDTAQSIMRGIAFRFADLRTLFYAVQETTKHLKKSVPVVVVPCVHKLTINFRSHSGILCLAASVIDLLKEFFPSSFDTLPGDEGMFPGPTPALLYSCRISDLAVLLRNKKREASQIEFGAHQVIIVQSEATKKALPDVLQAGIVLTVFEAKGLEFDDVLLYNFFADSMVSTCYATIHIACQCT